MWLAILRLLVRCINHSTTRHNDRDILVGCCKYHVKFVHIPCKSKCWCPAYISDIYERFGNKLSLKIMIIIITTTCLQKSCHSKLRVQSHSGHLKFVHIPYTVCLVSSIGRASQGSAGSFLWQGVISLWHWVWYGH